MNEDVRYWFEQVLEVPAARRAAFLETRCPDECMRAEVLSLLEFDSSEVEPPDTIRIVAESALGESASPPRRVGAFELGQLLGSGGMGFVYEGHRADGEVRQRVAVKFAQVSPSATEEFRAGAHRRFVRERQVLASLRHPYIAGLIDAGSTADGTPYAVIEQVDGVPIDRYSDTHGVDRAGRIGLVLKLCDAVQFAHRNLIVHSDIKPDNVLVTADGIPKLIDFGVASDLSEEAPQTTVRAFTPGYASPEQVRGLRATVATDVYGLGAVLHRLVTGQPPRPARPTSIRPDLERDLENILLKALEPDPQRRYGSVPELADDLSRFLARLPVRASPDSALYRASRFARRHWTWLGAAALLLAAMAATAVFSYREKQSALKRAADTRRLSERLLFEVHDEIGGIIGGTRAREKLGEIAVQYLEGLEREHGSDPELAWELLNAYARLGQSRGGGASSLGDTRSGGDFAARALALGEAAAKSGLKTDRLDRLFGIYDGLVSVFVEADRKAEARAAIGRMLEISQQLSRLRQAQALKQLARYEGWTDSAQRSAEAWGQALSVLREVAGSGATRETLVELTDALVGYGRAQALAGDFTGAAASLREGIRIAGTRTAAEPGLAREARQLYWSHIALGDVLGSTSRFSLGRAKEAATHYRMAQQLAERLVAGDAANAIAKLDLARALSREAAVVGSDNPAHAVQLLERSYGLARVASPENQAAELRFEYLAGLVGPLVQLGRTEAARDRLAEARQVVQRIPGLTGELNRRVMRKTAAMYFFATGRPWDALAEAQAQLAMMPRETRTVLSENYPTVELLERMLTYAAGRDPAACATAAERLDRIWVDLGAAYPRSVFVRQQGERARAGRCRMPL